MLSSIKTIILPATFQRAILSGIAKKSLATYHKVTIKAQSKAQATEMQMTYHYDKTVVHQNYSWSDGITVIEKLLCGYFKQAVINCSDYDYHVLATKKGRLSIVRKPKRPS